MFFSQKVLAYFTLAQIVSTSLALEDMQPSKAACGKDRCVSIKLKSTVDDAVWGARSADAKTFVQPKTGTVATQILFEYDKYFDFDPYDVMCQTCYTALPKTTVTTTMQATQYVRDDQNCKTAPVAGAVMGFTRPADMKDVLSNVPAYRIMPASFFQDKTADSSTAVDRACMARGFDNYVDPCCLESSAPSAKPTLAPTTKAPTTPAPKKNPCFSSVATVNVKGKGQTSMKALQIGDMVQTPHGYEKVYTIDHRNENKPTDFVQIHTKLDGALELTSEHLIYLHGKHDPVEAGSVVVGDLLLSVIGSSLSAVQVTDVSTVTRNGLYNPITSSGTIVVDGVVTSTYTAVDVTGGSHYLTISGYKMLSMHDFMHLAMGPFKTLCMSASGFMSESICSIEKGEEHNAYNKIGLQLLSFGKNQSNVVQTCIVIVLIALFLGFYLTCNPTFVVMSLMYALMSKKTQKSI